MKRFLAATAIAVLALAALALHATFAAPAARAMVSCADLAKAPLAPADDAAAARATEVWRGVARVTTALTGLGAELRVLAPGARAGDGQPFPPNAVTCAEKTGVVIYLTDTLIDLVFSDQRYPVDFLAFVLGHELGHRMNDLDAAGKPLDKPRGATSAPGQPAPDRESLADMRGAYLATAAGFSTRRLTCEDCLNHYLNAEARLPPETRLARKASLTGLLGDFETWESLYDAGVALAFWGFGAEAKRVLAWAESETKRLSVPVPELQVLHALVLMMGAAENAPWLSGTKVPPEAVAHLRCTPIYPAHSTLWEDIAPGQAARGDGDTEAARQDLLQARRLLKTAEELGAGELITASAGACVSTYLGQTREAEKDLERARKLLPKKGAAGWSAELEQAIAGNEAFAELVSVVKGKLIEADDAAGWKAFTAALEKSKAALEQSPDIGRLARALVKAGPRGVPPADGAKRDAAACPAPSAPLDASDVLPTMPRAPAAGGGCPCGWVPSGQLVGATASPDAPAAVTLCVPAGWGSGQRWMAIHLPAAGQAPAVDLDMLLVDRVPDRLASVGAWTKSCDALERRGMSDRGEAVFAAQCPKLGLENGVIFGGGAGSGGACSVARAVLLEQAQ
ncbi:MAG: hypothetical protein U1F43_30985 [Myxococcota bacterium]